ncbi:MAG: SPOR domain-containing protein [Gammaproteobacteria bacterium]|nr:SPOR domain-containing protein [Gammaproteobacteria bacterium]
METLSTWKKLVIQAFNETPISTDRQSRCSVFHIQQFIYQALQNAGIENRSPFTLWQLLLIHYQSKGSPNRVRELCIQTIRNMQKPATGFNARLSVPEYLGILFTLFLFIAPQTATTFRTPDNGHSILKILVPPLAEIDQIEVHLPTSSDYLAIAGAVKIAPPVTRLPSGLAGRDWILQQQDSKYTLQLVSASHEQSLERFCKKHDICQASATYQTTLKGKSLNRLLFGVYSNHKAAKLAKSQLPDALKKISPWPRQFKQIKQEL